MLTVAFLRRFRQRPAHFFNALAGFQLAIGVFLFARCAVQGINIPRGFNSLLAGGMFATSAVTTFLGGLICELVIRGPLQMKDELPVATDEATPHDDPIQCRQQDNRRAERLPPNSLSASESSEDSSRRANPIEAVAS